MGGAPRPLETGGRKEKKRVSTRWQAPRAALPLGPGTNCRCCARLVAAPGGTRRPRHARRAAGAASGAASGSCRRARSVGDDEVLLGAAGMKAAHLRHLHGQPLAHMLKGHLKAVHAAGLQGAGGWEEQEGADERRQDGAAWRGAGRSWCGPRAGGVRLEQPPRGRDPHRCRPTAAVPTCGLWLL